MSPEPDNRSITLLWGPPCAGKSTLVGEEPAYDPEVLAEEAIDSWLETPAGQQFNLFDRDQR